MLTGVARFQVGRVIGVCLMWGRPMMLVRGQSVVVLGMIVVGVLVNVQRRDLASIRGQDQSEQD